MQFVVSNKLEILRLKERNGILFKCEFVLSLIAITMFNCIFITSLF